MSLLDPAGVIPRWPHASGWKTEGTAVLCGHAKTASPPSPPPEISRRSRGVAAGTRAKLGGANESVGRGVQNLTEEPASDLTEKTAKPAQWVGGD